MLCRPGHGRACWPCSCRTPVRILQGYSSEIQPHCLYRPWCCGSEVLLRGRSGIPYAVEDPESRERECKCRSPRNGRCKKIFIDAAGGNSLAQCGSDRMKPSRLVEHEAIIPRTNQYKGPYQGATMPRSESWVESSSSNTEI